MSKSNYTGELWGKEISQLFQIVMNAQGLGADEHFWKQLSADPEILEGTIDAITKKHGKGYCSSEDRFHTKLFCFSQTRHIALDEPHRRIKNLGGSFLNMDDIHEMIRNDWMSVPEELEKRFPRQGIFVLSPSGNSENVFHCRLHRSEYKVVIDMAAVSRVAPGSSWPEGSIFAVLLKK